MGICLPGGNDHALFVWRRSKRLGKFAWYFDNSEEKSQKVGQKKPNPWGLYDMHGNVVEWTADQYVADYFERIGGGAANPFAARFAVSTQRARRQLEQRPRATSIRVSCWVRASWQQQDPQLPKSVWYLTDAPWLGFRIARPEEVRRLKKCISFGIVQQVSISLFRRETGTLKEESEPRKAKSVSETSTIRPSSLYQICGHRLALTASMCRACSARRA